MMPEAIASPRRRIAGTRLAAEGDAYVLTLDCYAVLEW